MQRNETNNDPRYRNPHHTNHRSPPHDLQMGHPRMKTYLTTLTLTLLTILLLTQTPLQNLYWQP